MTSENNTIGKRIMALRKTAGMTQEQLAEKLGVSPQAVSKWENDVSCPDISTLPLIASIFGVSTDELLGIKQPTPRATLENISQNSPSRPKGLGTGILMMVFGAAFLLIRPISLPFALWDILWPTVLLGVGIARTIEHRSVFFAGIAVVGLYFLLANLGNAMPFEINLNTAWPLALILAGLDVVLHRLFPSVFHSAPTPGTRGIDNNAASMETSRK